MTAIPTSQSTDTDHAATATTRRWRAGVVVAAALAALVTWLIANIADSSSVQVRMQGSLSGISTVQVLFTAALVALAGWALLAVLEHFTGSGRRIWTAIAAVVLVLSFIAPLSYGVGAASKATLLAVHIVTGMVLIVGLGRSSVRG